MDELATVVLAAGSGSRFGGIKQLAPVDGRPLLSRALAALEGFEGPRIVVLGARAELLRPLVAEAGWKATVAADWRKGLGASLRAGLAAAPAADGALISLGDLPWLRREAVERVLAAAARAPAEVEAVRAFDHDVPGHPLLIRGGLLARARRAPDGGLRPLLASARMRRVPCAGLGVARDVDTAEDLEGGRRD